VSNRYDDIILKLVEGETVDVEFDSMEERNRFRVAIYQAKKRFEEIMIMMDPVYEIRSLQFKTTKESPCRVSLSLFSDADRRVKFKILPANPSGSEQG